MSFLTIIKEKRLVYIVLISFFLDIAISPLRGYVSLMSSAVVGFALYFIFTTIVIKKFANAFTPIYLLLAIVIGNSIFQVPARIFYFNSSLSSLPDYIMHIVGVFAGYWFILSRQRYLRTAIALLSIILCLFVYFKGYSMWMHKLNHDTFTGLVTLTPHITNVEFQTDIDNTLTLESFKGKYLVLDCWYTYCGVCYEKFPQVQKLYDTYKDNPEVIIYAMHSRLENQKDKEDVKKGSSILQKRGYSFPCLSIDMDNPVIKELGVNTYPTVLIFDKESNLIFRGRIEIADKFVKKLLKKTGS